MIVGNAPVFSFTTNWLGTSCSPGLAGNSLPALITKAAGRSNTTSAGNRLDNIISIKLPEYRILHGGDNDLQYRKAIYAVGWGLWRPE